MWRKNIPELLQKIRDLIFEKLSEWIFYNLYAQILLERKSFFEYQKGYIF